MGAVRPLGGIGRRARFRFWCPSGRGEALASAAQVVGREKQGFGTLPAPLGAGAESQGREQRTPYLGSALS